MFSTHKKGMSHSRSVHIGIDARMYSSRFTGIGRYVHELTDRLFLLKPEWKFTIFLAEKAFQSYSPPAKNIQKVLAPETHYSFGEQTSFLKKISKEKYDLFHFPHFNAPIFYRGKSVVTIHDLTISFYPGKKKTSLFHKLGYKAVLSNIVKKSKRIITVSHHTKQDLMKLHSVPDEKITVIWNGLGKEFYRSEQNENTMKNVFHALCKRNTIQKPYFLYTGVHREHKNVVGMIQAFHKCRESGIDAELLITGKEDPFYPEIGEIIEKYNLSECVKRVGLVDENELRALFYHARVFVFPSFYEGFGLPPLEAMAMEIPVTASNAASIPEICGDAALFFDPKNTEEMSTQMSLLFQNEAKRNECIQKGKNRCELFSWEKMAQETLNVYETVLLEKN